MTELLLMRQAQLTVERDGSGRVCVCGRGVGMSTPPHATPKRIMHIESIDSACCLGAKGYS